MKKHFKTILVLLCVFCLTVSNIGCSKDTSSNASTFEHEPFKSETLSKTDTTESLDLLYTNEPTELTETTEIDDVIETTETNKSEETTETEKETESEEIIETQDIAETQDVTETQVAIEIESETSQQDKTDEINSLREDYCLGTCKSLSGSVTVIVFYIDDFESQWTDYEIDYFTQYEIEPGLDFLEQQAFQYGIQLSINIEKIYSSIYYDNDVIISIKNTGLVSIDVLKQAASEIGYSSTKAMIESFRELYQTDEVICLTVFNKNGTAYAINPKRNSGYDIDEHCIIFVRDLTSNGNDPVGSQSSVVAHETLHLFGAEDFYSNAQRKDLAKIYYPYDIMLGTAYYISNNNIGDATAFYIGWINDPPSILFDSNWQ